MIRVTQPETIPPPDPFVEQANVTDEGIYDEFARKWPDCWERAAAVIDWQREYDRIVERIDEPPYYRFFVNGRLNAVESCVDRHVRAGNGDRDALVWIGERGETRTYTYEQLYEEVNELAAAFRELGVGEDDVVALYMPPILELPISMLAAARIGAQHLVVSGEYSLRLFRSFVRETDAGCLVTCDGYYHGGETQTLRNQTEWSVADLNTDLETVVVNRLGTVRPDELGDGQHAYDSLLAEHRGETVSPVGRDADDTLFLIYTSDTAGVPLGMRHTTGGYLSYVTWTSKAVLDISPGDRYWCSAGIEWITGHSYVVYGPLARGATVVIYEGAPDYPDRHRPWEIIEENDVTQFYTTPTAIRTFRDWGETYPDQHDLSSLRLLGTVGQRMDPDTWEWFYTHVGDESCPIVDTYWQTESGGIVVSTLPGLCEMVPGTVGRPLPGIDARVVDADGEEVEPGEAGYLVFERPWPGMFRPMEHNVKQVVDDWTEFGDPHAGEWVYFSEDGATIDTEGNITILGRLDDVLNVGNFSKNRVHTHEIEEVVRDIDGVASATVVVGDHDVKGEAPYAFVVPDTTFETGTRGLRGSILRRVKDELSPMARPEQIYFVPALPRTDSGTVLHRVLEDLVNNDQLGDTGALRNPEVLDLIAVEVRFATDQ